MLARSSSKWRRCRRSDGPPARRAALHPLGQGGDLLIFELSLGGHLDVPLVTDRRDQRARVGLARKHDRPTFGPLEHRVSRVEPQTTFALFAAMTIDAAAHDDGADLRLEKLLLRPLIGLAARGARCPQQGWLAPAPPQPAGAPSE